MKSCYPSFPIIVQFFSLHFPFSLWAACTKTTSHWIQVCRVFFPLGYVTVILCYTLTMDVCYEGYVSVRSYSIWYPIRRSILLLSSYFILFVNPATLKMQYQQHEQVINVAWLTQHSLYTCSLKQLSAYITLTNLSLLYKTCWYLFYLKVQYSKIPQEYDFT